MSRGSPALLGALALALAGGVLPRRKRSKKERDEERAKRRPPEHLQKRIEHRAEAKRVRRNVARLERALAQDALSEPKRAKMERSLKDHLSFLAEVEG